MSSEPLTETEDFLTERSAYSATSDVARLRQVVLGTVRRFVNRKAQHSGSHGKN